MVHTASTLAAFALALSALQATEGSQNLQVQRAQYVPYCPIDVIAKLDTEFWDWNGCGAHSGYSFFSPTRSPTATQIKKMCNDNKCKKLLQPIIAKNLADCKWSIFNSFKLRSGLLDPINKQCWTPTPPPVTPAPTTPAPTTPAPTTPAPTTATPAPTPEPTTATPEPTTVTPEPTTATPEPTTATPEPTTTEPCTIPPDPTTNTPEPTTVTPEPTTATPEPTTVTPEPSTATPEPTTVTPEPTTATPEPTTTEPCTIPPDPTTNTPEPTTVTPEPTTATPEPTTVTPEPTTATPEPTTVTPEPSTATPEPTTTEPCTIPPNPTTATPEPTTVTPEPTTATPEPTTATPEPTTVTPEPTTATPEPTTATPEPTTVTPEPTTVTPEPTTATPAPTTTAPPTSGGPCGNSKVGPLPCPAGEFCQPWTPSYYQCRAIDAACGAQQVNMEYTGNSFKTHPLTLPELCCDKCRKNKDCAAYTFVISESTCYLKKKKDLGELKKREGAVSSQSQPLTCAPKNSNCGSDQDGANCCQSDQYCQPMTPYNYVCSKAPSKCKNPEVGVSYAGNDLRSVEGLEADECCNVCDKDKQCKAYTFMKYGVKDKSVCYLKSAVGEKVPTVGAVSATHS